jgi:hypothetical protein
MNTSTITDFFSTLTTTQWIIAALVLVMLLKKLIKFAIVVGLIVFVVFPYIKSSGMLDDAINQAGFLKTLLEQLGLVKEILN